MNKLIKMCPDNSSPDLKKVVHRYYRPAVLTAVVLGLLLVPAPQKSVFAQSDPREVLILHSYYQGFTWTDNVTRGIISVLGDNTSRTNKKNRVKLNFEYLDAKRNPELDYLTRMKDLLSKKYGRKKLDCIICSDNHALAFLDDHKNELFPSAPVVFCGVNKLREDYRERIPRLTGVMETLDSLKTLKLALRLHPETRDIVVITDISRTGKLIKKQLQEKFSSYTNKHRFRYLDDLTMQELQNRLQELTKGTIVLFYLFNIDAAGNDFTHEHSLQMVAEVSTVPVYSVWGFYFGHGIVGGRLTSGYEQGRVAGELTKRILSGEKASLIPVVTKSPNRYLFDYRQLEQFGIDQNELPPGSQVRFEPVTFFSRYAHIIWPVVVFIVLETFLLIVLLVNRRRRIRAELDIMRLNNVQEALLSSIPALVYFKDRDLKYMAGNRAFCEAAGMKEEELSGKTDFDLFGYQEAVFYRKFDENVIKNGTTYFNIEEPLTGSDGKTRWVLTTKVPYRDEEDNIIGMIGTTLDISERKEAQDALAGEKEQLAVTLRSLQEAVITLDKNGTVVLCNRSAEMAFGLESADMIGKLFSSLMTFYEEKGDIRFNIQNEIMQSPEYYQKPWVLALYRNRERRIVEMNISPVRNQHSEFVGHVLVFRDITDKRRIDKELARAQQLESLGTLAGGIAHDFNNILTVLIGNLSMIRVRIPDDLLRDMDLEGLIKESEEAAVQARELTAQLLTFSSGGMPAREHVSIDKLVRSSAEFCLRGSNAELVFEAEENLAPGYVDASQISQAVQNLVINADQAMPDGGRVTIRLYNQSFPAEAAGQNAENAVVIHISDTGPGMDEHTKKHAFDPFFTTRDNGNGLGLAIVHSIVSQHDGLIEVASQQKQGTTLKVILPAGEYGKEKTMLARGEMPRGDEKVLVMDDDSMVRQTMVDMLKALGYSVVWAVEGSKAIKLFQDAVDEGEPFDLVIVDLTVPGGMGGKEMAHILGQQWPRLKIIASSGYSTDPIMSNFREYGFSGVIAKPYRIDELARTVAEVLME